MNEFFNYIYSKKVRYMGWNGNYIKNIYDEIKKVYEEIKPIIDKRIQWEKDVREYLKFLPSCPLIKKMYGSMEAAFGVFPETLKYTYEMPVIIKPSSGLNFKYLGNILTEKVNIIRGDIT